MANKVLIVGSSRGIGLETAKQLLARGDSVVATCRNSNSEVESLGCEVLEGIDVTDLSSLSGLKKVKDFDWLLVVAGVLKRDGLHDFSEESIRQQFETNALGPLRVVQAVKSSLTKDVKVGLLTSRMGSVADNSSGGSYGYRMSKAALNMAGKSLSIELPEVAIRLIHPGWVRTEMTGGTGHLSVEESAEGIIKLMDNLTLAQSGSFFHVNGEPLPW